MPRLVAIVLTAAALAAPPALADCPPLSRPAREQLHHAVDQLTDRYADGWVVRTVSSPTWCRPSGSCEVRIAYWHGRFQPDPPPRATRCSVRVLVAGWTFKWLERTLDHCEVVDG